jgi:flavorubredoxin
VAKVLIVYHTQSGNTEAMAKAVSEGAKTAGATVVLKKASEAGVDDLLSADVVAIGTPNYFGYMAGMIKDFFDRVWATVRDKVVDKPYVVFGSKGGGGAQALESVERICDGIKMARVSEGLMSTRQPTQDVLTQCKELGKKLAQPGKLEKLKTVQEPRS